MKHETDVLIKRLQQLTEELGHVPTFKEWTRATDIKKCVIDSHFSVKINSRENSACVFLRYDLANTPDWQTERVIHETMKDTWKNFQIMAGVGEYNYTKEELIAVAKNIIASKGEILPEQWPLSHVAIIRLFGSWSSFIRVVYTSQPDASAQQCGDSLEELLKQIANLEKKLLSQYNLRLNWSVEKPKGESQNS